MAESVKGERGYRSAVRAERAAATRRLVLAAARDLFVEAGYRATGMADIAARAGVAMDTVYAVGGRKPALLRQLVESAISSVDEAVPPADRDYVARVRAARGARAKIEEYADGIAAIQPRLAPVFLALRDAATTDPECAAVWASIAERRARNMREFARDLLETGELRTDLDVDTIADVVWTMNAAEYYGLLVQRGWAPSRYRDLIVDTWTRWLLAAP